MSAHLELIFCYFVCTNIVYDFFFTRVVFVQWLFTLLPLLFTFYIWFDFRTIERKIKYHPMEHTKNFEREMYLNNEKNTRCICVCGWVRAFFNKQLCCSIKSDCKLSLGQPKVTCWKGGPASNQFLAFSLLMILPVRVLNANRCWKLFFFSYVIYLLFVCFPVFNSTSFSFHFFYHPHRCR